MPTLPKVVLARPATTFSSNMIQGANRALEQSFRAVKGLGQTTRGVDTLGSSEI